MKSNFLGYLIHCSLCDSTVLSRVKESVCPDCLEFATDAPKPTLPKVEWREFWTAPTEDSGDYPVGEVQG